MSNQPQFGEFKPVEPKPPKDVATTATTWFWLITIGAVVVAPLSIFLIRLALGAF